MADLRTRAISGVRWTTLNTIFSTSLHLIQLAILARILGPEAYGLMALVSLVTGLAHVFSDTGLSSAIIHRKAPSHEELSTLYWLNVLVGLLIYSTIFLITPFIAIGFDVEELKALLPVAAVSFIVAPFGAQFGTLLEKRLRFDIVTKINMASSLVGVAVAIGLALNDYGVWSFVWGRLSQTLTGTGMRVIWAWTAKLWPSLRFRWTDTQGYLSFGLYRVGAMSANYFSARVDQLVIGAMFGPVALGYYNIAFRLVIDPQQRINPILTKVAFPVFSKIQDDNNRLRKGFIKMISLLMSVNAPMLIGFASVASVAVPILLGEKWESAIPLVQVLAIYTLIRSLGNAGGSLILAKGKANWTFYWNIAATLLVPPIIYIAGMSGDIINICYALVGLQLFLFLCHYKVFIRNLIGPCFSEYLATIMRPVTVAVVMGFAIMTMSSIPNMTSDIFLFTAQVITGIALYIALSLMFQKAVVREFIRFILPSRIPGSTPP